MIAPKKLPPFISSQVLRGDYVFLDRKIAPKSGMEVVCAGREECAPDYSIARNQFHYHAVEFIIGGKWHLEMDGRGQEIGPGALFAYGPHTRYLLRAVSRTGLVKYFVDFNGASARQTLRQAGLLGGIPLQAFHTRWLQDIFDQLIDCANISEQSARRIAAMLATLLFARIKEDIHADIRQTRARESYEFCRRYINTNYPSLNGIREVAQACGVSPAYLSRLFQRFAPESPLRYLTRMKMQHAAELVLRGNLPIKAVAALVGFEDPYHFSRVFKSVHGIAPSQFPDARRT